MFLLKTVFWKQLCTISLCALLSLNCFSSVALAQSISEANSIIGDQAEYITNLVTDISHPILGQTSNLAFIFRIFRRRQNEEDGAPKKNTGTAGRRGPCHALNQSFTALVPRDGIKSPESLPNIAVGFTAQVQPTTFVYLPDLSNSRSLPSSAQFMVQQLQDGNEIDILENPKEISLSAVQGGIAAIHFEDLGIQLEPNQAYHWYLSIICDLERPSRNPSVDAWLEVVNGDERLVLANQVSSILNDLDKVSFYVEQELWHEAITLLTALRCQTPGNSQYKAELKELLTNLFLDNEIESGIKRQIEAAVEIQQCPTQLRVASN